MQRTYKVEPSPDFSQRDKKKGSKTAKMDIG
jgi:hypothetical protein